MSVRDRRRDASPRRGSKLPALFGALALAGTGCHSTPGAVASPGDPSAGPAPLEETGSSTDVPPSFIVVLTDDQGYGDLGVQGAVGFRTPHLDAMAREGLRMTGFYMAAPVCTPSRAALLTGCHPRRIGLANHVLFPYSDTGLNADEWTLAEALHERGYRTMCVGKWHLGHHEEFLPWHHGFDEFFGVPYSNDMDAHDYKGRDFQAPPLPLYRNKEVIEEGPDQDLLTRRYTDAAIEFVRENAGRPFFLYLAHSMPHLPLHASREFRGRTELGLYGDVIEEIDHEFGRLMGTVRELGLAERTVVVFTSDNGPAAGQASSAGPFRGRKGSTWEGGLRVPLLVWGPGHIPAGGVRDELMTAMDVMPTLCEMAGAPLSGNRIDGASQVPLWTGVPGARSPHEGFVYYHCDRLEAVRLGRWKLHVHRPEWNDQDGPWLYNLETDPGETTDVAAERPEVVRVMLGEARRFRAELGDRVTGVEGWGVRPAGERGDR